MRALTGLLAATVSSRVQFSLSRRWKRARRSEMECACVRFGFGTISGQRLWHTCQAWRTRSRNRLLATTNKANDSAHSISAPLLDALVIADRAIVKHWRSCLGLASLCCWPALALVSGSTALQTKLFLAGNRCSLETQELRLPGCYSPTMLYRAAVHVFR